MRSIVYNSSLKTEIGTLFITANDEKILGIHFVSDCPPDNENYLTKALKQELVEYFQKKRTTFSTFPLSLSSLEEKIFTKNLKALKANRYAEVKRNGGIVRVNRQSSQHQQSKRWEEENWKKLNKILL